MVVAQWAWLLQLMRCYIDSKWLYPIKMINEGFGFLCLYFIWSLDYLRETFSPFTQQFKRYLYSVLCDSFVCVLMHASVSHKHNVKVVCERSFNVPHYHLFNAIWTRSQSVYPPEETLSTLSSKSRKGWKGHGKVVHAGEVFALGVP